MIKSILLTGLYVSMFLFSNGQAKRPYDSKLADSLNADAYGMKQYMLVILRTGPNQPSDSTIRNQLFRGHMDNIQRLAERGSLVVAGPFGKNDQFYRGLFILNTDSEMKARDMVNTDPAVSYGLFKAEYIPWYGSAALPMYLPFHSAVQKQSF